ncbi:aminoglycoside 6-adenylyltransferase [Staphylococcus kloosii]|uniref:aminoglycoside 6-adenylyltransferase n=1 Tax=Staphylococcus kloosii TaxID=29384 RepID=UPI00189E6AE7|nr:aminoglycoside 6-adenylyltransferase [Staphylococcus kloosii]MBF7023113.1 aminoglycoside 6-adenylyltransferase [Staphylococcus kloosii]
MRSSTDMYELILHIAQNNNHVKVVCENGSRVNKRVKADQYQDYDIVFIVDDFHSAIKDLNWIEQFGKRIITQFPEAEELFTQQFDYKYPILMLFDDYNRIDLTIVDINHIKDYLQEDSLTEILLDKDKVISEIEESNDSSHWIKEPTPKMVEECLTEFYWVSTYVMKGIWREELLYAIDSLNNAREMLLLILSWRVGYKYNFEVNMGKSYKYLLGYLSDRDCVMLGDTYPTLNTSDIKEKLYSMIRFFDEIYIDFCQKINYQYQHDPYKEVKEYIEYETK